MLRYQRALLRLHTGSSLFLVDRKDNLAAVGNASDEGGLGSLGLCPMNEQIYLEKRMPGRPSPVVMMEARRYSWTMKPPEC